MSNKIKKLEWETFAWPVNFTHLSCVKGLYAIPTNAVITIERDQNFKLKATLFGQTDNSDNLNYKDGPTSKPGAFIKTETIKGYNTSWELFEISGAFLTNIRSTGLGALEGTIHNFDCNLILNDFTQTLSEDEADSLVEFYLSGKTNFFYPRSTRYKTTSRYTRVRQGIEDDNPRELISEQGSNSGFNYFFIKTENFECFVQNVDKLYLPTWANGLQIEYRKGEKAIPDENTRMAVMEIVSFILGTQLLSIGNVELDSVHNVLRRRAVNPWGDNVVALCSAHARPPIKLDGHENRIRVEQVINLILPTYLEKREPYKLVDVLWKYWIARELAIGTNLPILSSALETLCDSYVDANNLTRKFTREEKEQYHELVKEELKRLEETLEKFEFKNRVIDKIKNPFNVSGNEKLKIFLEHLNFEFPKNSVEQKAIRARNAMAHSSIETDEDTSMKYIKLSHAYEIIVHRVILRILRYNETYLDYHNSHYVERNMDENLREE